MPQLGESVAEGTIGKWLKQPGDSRRQVRAAARGHHGQGQRRGPVAVRGRAEGDPRRGGSDRPEQRRDRHDRDVGGVGHGYADGGTPPRRRRGPPAAPTARPLARRRSDPAARELRQPPRRQPPSAPASTAPSPATAAAELPGSADARMTPAVRRLLREHGLEPALIVGTGGGGRITREDVLDYVEAQRTGKAVNAQRPAAAEAAPAAPSAPLGARALRAVRAGAVRPACRRPLGLCRRRPARLDRVPRRDRRSPGPDDPDAQGHRGPDDSRPADPARLRAHGGRRHEPRPLADGAPSATTGPARASR